jgi:hypothetical protein
MSRNHFKDTGLPNPKKRAYQAAGSSNNLIATPGSGKQIVVYDIIVAGSSDDQIIRDGSAGSILIHMGDGHIALSCPIGIGENKPLWIAKSGDATTSYAITVTYSIEEV